LWNQSWLGGSDIIVETEVKALPLKRRLALKTWHWMVILPMIAITFKVATWVIAAGLDGRIVVHRHASGHIGHPSCTTPFTARLVAVIRGTSTLDYACPWNPSRIVSESTYWPHSLPW